MEYKKIQGIEKPISRLIQGTVMLNKSNLEESIALLDGVFDLGCTTFDTAHSSGNGECERMLGYWINQRGIRDQVVVIGKGAHHNQDRQRVTPNDITSDLFDSLMRQNTDFIDIYLLHRDDPTQPVGPIIEVLNEHCAAGRIHAFGASNWTAARIEAANEYAFQHNLKPFVVSSPNFSLAVQRYPPFPNSISIAGPDLENERSWYITRNMPIFAWSSLAGGFFSGRFTRDNLDTFESYRDMLCVNCYCTRENFERMDRVKVLAAKYNMSIPQIAIAYVLSHPLNLFAVVGCVNTNEYKSISDVLSFKLNPKEIAWLELPIDTPL